MLVVIFSRREKERQRGRRGMLNSQEIKKKIGVFYRLIFTHEIINFAPINFSLNYF